MNFDWDAETENMMAGLREVLGPLEKSQNTPLTGHGGVTREEILKGLLMVSKTGCLRKLFTNEGNSVMKTALREELASISPPLFLSLELGNGLILRLLKGLGQEGRDMGIDGLLEGREIGAAAILEGHANLEENPFSTKIIREDRQGFISGQKRMVINGKLAHHTMVWGNGGGGILLAFLVGDEGGLGYSLPSPSYLREGLFWDLSLNNYPIPLDGILGPFEPKRCLSLIIPLLDESLIGLSLGLMKRAFQDARAHSKAHISGGRPIISYQEVGFKLSEMLTMLQASQHLAYRAAWMADKKDKEAGILLCCAKVFCAESAERLLSDAMQIMGTGLFGKDSQLLGLYPYAKLPLVLGTSAERARVRIGDLLLMGS